MTEGNSQQATLFGHPTGLFTLFFAEMWERFSYYGMRALLTLYMIKGFLGYGDKDAYAVYGAYTALVYMTPFFGGMLADRLLGQRRAVIIGGVLMSLGHLVMTIQQEDIFFVALALLILGNGFFKPNISTMVGSLYGDGDKRRDGGFTIFYIGINLGAALAPLLCGYVGETYGWHMGFGLATLGMLIGLLVFWAPRGIAQALILGGAVVTGGSMVYTQLDKPWFMLLVYTIMAIALVVSAWFAFRALGLGGLPEGTGAPPSKEALSKPVFGLPAQFAVYAGIVVAIPILTILVSSSRQTKLISQSFLDGLGDGGGFGEVAATILGEMSTPAGLILTLAGAAGLLYLIKETFTLQKVAKERMFVVLILTFFSLLFWSFFEQAGSSMNNFTDRNVDRVIEERTVAADEVGKTIVFRIPLATEDEELAKLPALTQEQLGRINGDAEMNRRAAALVDYTERYDPEGNEKELDAKALKEVEAYVGAVGAQERFTMTALTAFRDKATKEGAEDKDMRLSWLVVEDNVGMGVGGDENPASVFQAANPMFILIFGLIFTILWTSLARTGREPSTPFKFAMGLLQLGLGFVALWMGASGGTDRGMVTVWWLVLGYLLHTTGELCLSPVGLSMVTKLSPTRLVSTVMGSWFLATAFSNFLAAIIAQFTGVNHGGDGKAVIPAPSETMDTYGDVFGKIGLAGVICAAICFALVPILKKWMHEGEPAPD